MGARDVIFTILAIDEASRTFDKIGRKAEETGARFGPLGKAAGFALGAIAVGAAAAAVKGIEMAASFQSTMEQLHTQAGVGQKAVDQLSGSVLNLAGKVGTDPDSLAEALYHIESSFASTGITGAKAMHLLQTAAEGAKVGHANLVDVTNALDAAIASGIPGVKNFDQAMGMLNATVGSGDMHMQDLADAFGTGAVAVVKNYGLSLRDVGAALATFGDNNIRGAEAGTALRMSVQSLAVPAKGGKQALEELGLQSDTLAKAMQHGGLSEAIRDLVDHLHKSGIGAKETGQILTEAFGKKAGIGLALLVSQHERLYSKYGEIDKAANKFGDTWKAQTQLLAQKWDEMRARTDAFLIRLGTALIPYAIKVLDVAAQIGPAFSAAWAAMQPVFGFIASHSTIFGAMAVSIGVLVGAWTAWKVATEVWTTVTKIATAVQAAFDAVMALNPIVLVVVALVALAAGLIYAYKHSETFRNAINAIWQALQTALNWVKGNWPMLVGALTGPIGMAVVFIVQHWGQIVGFFKGLGPQIAAAWDATIAFFESLPGKLVAGLEALPGLLLNLLKTTLEKAAFAVGFGLGMLVNLFIIWPFKVGEALAKLPGIIWHWITTSGVRGTEALGSFLGNWLSRIGGWLVAAGTWFARLPGVVVHWISTAGAQGAVAFVNFHTMLIAKAYALTTALISWVAALIPKIVDWFRRLPGMVVGELQKLPGQIKSVFSSAGSWLLDAGRQIVMGLVNGIKNAGGAALSAVKDLGGNLISGFSDAVGWNSPAKAFIPIGSGIAEGVEVGVRSRTPHVLDAVTTMVPTSASMYGGTSRLGGVGGGTHVHLHVAAGFVGSPDQLAAALSDVIQRAKSRGTPLKFA